MKLYTRISAKGAAIFSPCLRYRYELRRVIGDSPRRVNFVMLNPSTADEETNDPTVTRCLGFAEAWGFGRVVVTNLFAFRSTDPALLLERNDPTGPDNDRCLKRAARISELVVCAWGNVAHARLSNRASFVTSMLRSYVALHYLRLNANGQPAHPLYLPGDLKPQPYLGRTTYEARRR